MFSLIQKVEEKYKKPQLVDVRSGDTVRVHQRIVEGSKTRTQVFEGLVIRKRRMGSLNASILVRRIASGVGVEKGFMLHSPNVEKVEVVRRANVRRNYLSYMRQRGGKAARLASVDFDKSKVNQANEPLVPTDTTKEAKEAEKALDETKIQEAKEEQQDKITEEQRAAKTKEDEDTPESEVIESKTDNEKDETPKAEKPKAPKEA